MGKATKKKQWLKEQEIEALDKILRRGAIQYNRLTAQEEFCTRRALAKKEGNVDKVINHFYKVFPKDIYGRYFIRKPGVWRDAHKRLREQEFEGSRFYHSLADLAEFCMCKYPVPRVLTLDVVQYSFSKYFLWFTRASSGRPLYDLKKDFPMTRKECHYFLSDTGNESPNMVQAIIRAKALALGWSKDHMIFLYTYVLPLFQENDLVLVHDEIMDFLRFTMNWYGELYNEGGYQLRDIWDFVKNSGVSLKGRTPRTVTELSNEWHYEQKMKRLGDFSWEGYPIDDWNQGPWAIRQLTSSKALYMEARAMHHCVDTYTNEARGGGCAIFSVTKGGNRSATVEVRMSYDGIHLMVAQKKGPFNRGLDSETESTINLWCKENGAITYFDRW